MRPRARNALYAGALALLAAVVIAGAALAVFMSARWGEGASFSPSGLPSFEAVRAAHRPSDVSVLDRHGETLSILRVDYTERRGDWVPLHAVSPAFVNAVLLSEDRRFHQHDGVDWRAVAAAGWAWVSGGDARGASTISMQLVSMLDTSLRRPAGGRGVGLKLAQMRQARRIEASWSKAEILEAYVNLVAFRGELRGVDSVARVMFGKHAHGLDLRESAVAAALLRGPNAPPMRVAARACALLEQSSVPPGCEGLTDMTRIWLASAAQPRADTPALAPHAARLASARRSDDDSRVANSTLDAGLQRQVLASVDRHLAGMEQARLTDAAVVVLDNASGEILAYVGSSGANSGAAQVDHARARRQAGSTFKPFLYALALERRYLTAASLLDDAPLDVGTAGGLYVPQNYDRRHTGLVSVRTALASSLNIPAVRVLMLTGPERFAERLRQLGLPVEHEGDHYGYSLSLGSADVDLLSLTNAYRSLANAGLWSPASVLPAYSSDTSAGLRSTGSASVAHAYGGEVGEYGRDAVQVTDPLAAWIVGDILSDRRARAHTFGLENALATRHWSAVKTGTSKDMRDNWCLGWSDRYTVGVWVGNSRGESMRDVSGVSAAAPIWHEVMAFLHEGRAGRQAPPPAGLEQRLVTFAGGLEAARPEYFLPGTALAHVEPAVGGANARPRIVSPVADTVIALDPDIPMDVQQLSLRAIAAADAARTVRWRIDGRLHAEGATAYWAPRPGRHRIVLVDADDTELDNVTVQVRGLPRMPAR